MNKTFAIIQIAFRNIFRSKRRSFFSIFAVSLCVMFIVGMNSVFDGKFDEKAAFIQRLFLGHLQLSSTEFVKENDDYTIQFPLELDGETVSEAIKNLESNEHIERAFSRISTGVRLDNVHKKSAVLWGIDIERELEYHDFNSIIGNDGLVEGRFPKEKKEIIVGRGLLKKMRLKVGDSLVFKFRSYTGFEKYYKAKIVGSFSFIDESFDSNYIVIPHNILHRLSGFSPNQTQKINVFTKEGSLDSVKESLEYFKTDIYIKSWLEHPFVFGFTSSEVKRKVIALSFVVIGAFLLVLTILMVIKERMKEIGIISAMGMSRKEIISMFFYEGVTLSLLGSLIGALLMLIWLFIVKDNPFIFKSINPETGIEVINTLNFKFSIKRLIGGFFFVFSISSFISILPSLTVARIRPIDAIRG